jgi:hypothetical protein
MQFFSELTEEQRLYGWFQQDSATTHIARISMQALSDVFGDRIIRSGIWPAHSLDLNPCDFFVWGSSKDKVYSNNPRTEGELKENIRKQISNIPAEHFRRYIRTSSAGARNVYMYRDSIFNTCDLRTNVRASLHSKCYRHAESSAKSECAVVPAASRSR